MSYQFQKETHVNKGKSFHLILSFILCFEISVFPSSANALDPSTCMQAGYDIGYINGIWTPPDEAQDDADDLKKAVGTSYNGQLVTVKPLINSSAGKYSLQDLVETFQQRAMQIDSTGVLATRWDIFWDITDGNSEEAGILDVLRPGTAQLISELQNIVQSEMVLDFAAWLTSPPTETDYITHHIILDSWIRENKKILIVGHSQGNLFVDNDVSYAASKASPGSVGYVEVAPASVIPASSYILSDGDNVINALRKAGGVNTVASANVLGVPTNPKDVSGHTWQLSYLDADLIAGDGISLKAKVMDAIETALSELKNPTCAYQYNYSGPSFTRAAASGDVFISGNIQATVIFNHDMSNFTGAATNADIQSLDIYVPSTSYHIAYSGEPSCSRGQTINFDNGKITAWSLLYSSAQCVSKGSTDTYQLITSANGQLYDDRVSAGIYPTQSSGEYYTTGSDAYLQSAWTKSY